ncbi:MAG: response regulator transcription factor [Candidatus Competibacteraceae bacterium]|nr:response regulator transcription factor [Candidatus Competibacteraceae bacterium]MCB1810377.1 response regulator transcription factor [Candidatus Competibacteraceae bacterium]
MRIALVEDDSALAEMMAFWIREAGHECQVLKEGGALIRQLGHDSIDTVILDWMLPDTDGIQLLQWIRKNVNWPLPVIFVTGKDSEADIVRALTEGADDYMSKPVQRFELLARIDAVSRRSQAQEPSQQLLDFGAYTIDVQTRTVSLNDDPIEMTQKEFDLVLFLFRNAGRILSRGHIMESVWGRSPDLNTRTVDTHMSRIRSKLKLRAENGWRLRAVYQHGYRLEPTQQARKR